MVGARLPWWSAWCKSCCAGLLCLNKDSYLEVMFASGATAATLCWAEAEQPDMMYCCTVQPPATCSCLCGPEVGRGLQLRRLLAGDHHTN